MSDGKLFARTEKLFDIGVMSDARVLIAGCGSGGGQVALQLAMSGVRNFSLFDSDLLEEENLIRHVCGRRYLGQPKTAAVADVMIDRNPDIRAALYQVDLMESPSFEEQLSVASVVVLATDNDPTRYRINELCVKNNKPFVVGKVFTRGIGGEVFAYRPGVGGCLACLEKVLERSPFRSGIREIDLVSDEERDAIYGLETSDIKDSPGLNVDISFITSFHTRYALDAIAASLSERPKYMPAIPENYLVWGNRPIHPFSKHFQIQRIQVHRQEGCLVCAEGG